MAGTAAPSFSSYPSIVEEIRTSGVTLAELGKIAKVQLRQVQNWAAGTSKPGSGSRDRLVDVFYVVTQLREVYRGDGVEIWLHSRNRGLAGARPIDLLTAGQFEDVVQAVDRLASGAV